MILMEKLLNNKDMNKSFIFFVYIIIFFSISCNNSNEIKFQNNIYQEDYLNGNWELVRIGAITEKKSIMFDIDSKSSNFKKLKIDTDKMIFHLTSSPIKNREYPSKILIDRDTIKITVGTTTADNYIKILVKEKITYKFSDDLEYLKLIYSSDNSIMIFKKGLTKKNR